MSSTAVDIHPADGRFATLPRFWEAVTTRRALDARELACAWIALAIFCTLAFAPHVLHGGFYLDDWSNAAGALQPPGGPDAGQALSYFKDLTIYRPVLVVYVPLTYFVFGMHMALHLAWAAFLSMLAAAMLYGVLRTLGLPAIHAWLIAALTIVYPWSDSTRLWATASQVSLSVTFALAGLWIALVGLSRRSWRWHACAAILYLMSIFTYEVTLPLIAAAGILYTLRVGWRAARVRWGVDLAVVIAGGLWVGTHTARTKSSVAGDFEHLKQIITSGETIIGRSFIPLGAEHTTLVLAVLAATLVAGVAGAVRSERFADSRIWGLRGWLLLAVGGLLAAALGWIMFIPADPYYTPSIYGMTNRVNGLAGIGVVIAAYGAFGIVGTFVGRLRPRFGGIALTVTLVLGILLGTAYVDVIRRHTGIWNAAFVAETSALSEIQRQYPRLPHETVLFASGFPANQTLGVPILAASWDLDGMIKMQYDDGSLAAYPVLPGLHLACSPQGVKLEGQGAPLTTGSYGKARLFDLGTRRHLNPRNQRECRAAVGSYVPGPSYLSAAY